MNHCKHTYAAEKGVKPYDWWAFLRSTRKPVQDSVEMASIRVRAGSWVTCACGNQCDRIPRGVDHGFTFTSGEPKDRALSNLGVSFFDRICRRRWTEARATLIKIERRSSQILQALDLEERKKKNLAQRRKRHRANKAKA